jgi:hypothetical protein
MKTGLRGVERGRRGRGEGEKGGAKVGLCRALWPLKDSVDSHNFDQREQIGEILVPSSLHHPPSYP